MRIAPQRPLKTESPASQPSATGRTLKRGAAFAGLPLFIQPKLAMSRPGDSYEREADRVAEHVMRMPSAAVGRTGATYVTGGPPRSACQDDEPLTLSRTAQAGMAGEAPASVHAAIRSPGQPLGAFSRAFFEPRFGRDLGHVRVHTDGEAQRSAQDVNALAYTAGSHVVFGVGHYAPGTPEGQRLLAHELTHVVQQTGEGGSARLIARKPTDWPAWHQEALAAMARIAGRTGGPSAEGKLPAMLAYLCALPREKARSLHARLGRGAPGLIEHTDDFAVYVMNKFPVSHDTILSVLRTRAGGGQPTECEPPRSEPEQKEPDRGADSGVSKSNCRVDVRAVDPPVPIASHLFIVASKENGVEYGYRGGPDVPGGLFALIVTDVGRYEESLFPDWDPAAKSVTVLSGAAACGMAECFSQKCSDIDAAEIGYEFYGPNSNSVVSELLSSCGAPREKPDVWAPGWDVSLFDSPTSPGPGGP